ncbi:MAG TPA: ribulose-phosphate 3-epimerase [Firmicutes bacterium]|nr:ribulose-phosphate 3-epimerase [Bacillota bacterium]
MTAPSILDSDFSVLGATVKMLESEGADFIHLDVMDGRFVPQITFGPKIISSIRPLTKLVFDAHLMIEKPEEQAENFIKAGCDIINFHEEACKSPSALIDLIKKSGKKCGMTIKPGTPVDNILKYIDRLDLILIMSVEPGYGGQAFMPEQLLKLEKLRGIIDSNSYDCLLEIDGGIKKENAGQACDAGADVLVAGSAFFSKPDPAAALREFKKILEA